MGPFLVGWIKDATGSFENGLYALAAFMILAAVVTAMGCKRPGAASSRRGLPHPPRNKIEAATKNPAAIWSRHVALTITLR